MAPKILVVMTSHSKMGNSGKPTGWYLVRSPPLAPGPWPLAPGSRKNRILTPPNSLSSPTRTTCSPRPAPR